MKKASNIAGNRKGFSLAEVLAALAIGSMVLLTMLAVYNRAQSSAAAISRSLDSDRFASELLQQIAEDLDGIIDAGKNIKITVTNKTESHGFHTAQLEILKNYYDDQQRPQVLEKIIWQANYDYDGGSKSLVLYRAHSGIAREDKLLDAEKEDFEKELFVPVCSGITYFAVRIPEGDQFREAWTSDNLPTGIAVLLSFAEPAKNVAGVLDVPDYEKITRTVAIDRTRKMQFSYVSPESQDANQPQQDPNKITKQSNEPNKQ